MSNLTMEEKIDAIYRTVVKGAPASDELIIAAQTVVDVHSDSSKGWVTYVTLYMGLPMLWKGGKYDPRTLR